MVEEGGWGVCTRNVGVRSGGGGGAEKVGRK